MRLSFIIVNHNSDKYLRKSVLSILKNVNGLSFEIIVVNNGEKHENVLPNLPNIINIKAKENKGFGQANNIGAEKASGEILFFLNPDTVLIQEKDFSDLVNAFSNSSIGIVGPKLITNIEKKSAQYWCAGFETTLLSIIKNNLSMIKSKNIWESSVPVFADWVSGAALLIRKSLFEKIGGFDESFFMYFEDEDLCKRVREQGSRVLFFPKYPILHLGGKSFKNKNKQKEFFYNSQDYYFKKHFSKPRFLIMKGLRKIFAH